MVSRYRGEMASLCIKRDGFAVLGYLAHHLAYKVVLGSDFSVPSQSSLSISTYFD
jgi:hypothetical protein